MSPKQVIQIERGVKVDLLFTPSLLGVAARRGLSLVVADVDNAVAIMEAYVKVVYLAALNAWEAERYDNPELADFAYKYADFQAWAATNPKGFAALVPVAYECLTGQPLKDAVKLEKAGKEQGSGPVKKKSLTWRRRADGTS